MPVKKFVMFAVPALFAGLLTTTTDAAFSSEADPISQQPAGSAKQVDQKEVIDPLKAEPVSGPLLEERRALRDRIGEAQKKGIGSSSYWSAYKGIEQSVQTGEPQDAIAKRVDSLSTGLNEQLKRSRDLKTQRPIGPSHSAASSSGSGSGSGGFSHADAMSKLSSMDPDEKKRMLETLKNKYGDKLPGNLDPSMAGKFLNTEQGKEMMKRFSSGQ